MWSLRKQKDLIINDIKNKVKNEKVICALSEVLIAVWLHFY